MKISTTKIQAETSSHDLRYHISNDPNYILQKYLIVVINSEKR